MTHHYHGRAIDSHDPMFHHLLAQVRAKQRVQLRLRDMNEPLFGLLAAGPDTMLGAETDQPVWLRMFTIAVEASDGKRQFTMPMVFRPDDVLLVGGEPTVSATMPQPGGGILLG